MDLCTYRISRKNFTLNMPMKCILKYITRKLATRSKQRIVIEKRNICYWWALFLSSSYTKNLSVIVTLRNYKPARLNDMRYYVHVSHYDICNMNVKCDMLMYGAQTVRAQHEVSAIYWLIPIKLRLTQNCKVVYSHAIPGFTKIFRIRFTKLLIFQLVGPSKFHLRIWFGLCFATFKELVKFLGHSLNALLTYICNKMHH